MIIDYEKCAAGQECEYVFPLFLRLPSSTLSWIRTKKKLHQQHSISVNVYLFLAVLYESNKCVKDTEFGLPVVYFKWSSF